MKTTTPKAPAASMSPKEPIALSEEKKDDE
jgi:hypothetical protein